MGFGMIPRAAPIMQSNNSRTIAESYVVANQSPIVTRAVTPGDDDNGIEMWGAAALRHRAMEP